MSENQDYALEQIRQWVWSGFYSAEDVEEMLPDILEYSDDEDEVDEQRLRAHVSAELDRKRLAEAVWPAPTDCDRLDSAFQALHAQGICALHNAGYTQSQGHEDVAEFVDQAPAGKYHGFCFYHGQDVERAVDGLGLLIAFGDLQGDDEAGVAVGRAVAGALRDAGFTVDWDGTLDRRIAIPVLNWQRRTPV